MKSKAHFKKCSELGISPIPTMPDDDPNDFDDSASDRNHGASLNGRENDSRGDSETEDNDSDDDMDDESGDGKMGKSPSKVNNLNFFSTFQTRMSRRVACRNMKPLSCFSHFPITLDRQLDQRNQPHCIIKSRLLIGMIRLTVTWRRSREAA